MRIVAIRVMPWGGSGAWQDPLLGLVLTVHPIPEVFHDSIGLPSEEVQDIVSGRNPVVALTSEGELEQLQIGKMSPPALRTGNPMHIIELAPVLTSHADGKVL